MTRRSVWHESGVYDDGNTTLTVGGGDVAGDTHAASSKATPVDADEIPLADSVASFVLKKLTWANLKATVKAYTDTLYTTIGASAPPNGTAGGVLDGSYPNPGLAAGVAGAGLAETSDVLSVNVDGTTIEINTDTLRVKSGVFDAAGAASAAQAASQPLDSDLTAIAALTTTSYGRALLALADAAALRTAAALGNTATDSYATPAVVLGSAAAAGSAASLIHSDATIAAFDTTAPTTQAFGDAAAVGTAAFAARRDHKHAMMADPFLGTTAAAAIGGVIWTVVTKAADEDVSGSTTVQDDNHLFFTATSAAVYEFELILIYASPLSAGTPDIKFDLGEGGGTRGLYWKLGLATNDVTNFTAFPADQSTAVSGGTAAAKRMLYVAGTYLGGGGTFKVRWAQNTSDSNPTTVYTGSVLRYRRIV